MAHLPPRALRPLLAALLVGALSLRSPPAQGQAGNPSLRGDTWEATRGAGHGIVAVAFFVPLEGFTYVDASGKPGGLLVDMVEQFRSYLKNVRGADVTLRYVPYTDFTRFYDDVRRGQGGVFGLAGTTINEPRRKEVAFGPPYFSNVPVLLTNTAVPTLSSRERIPVEFAGFTGLAFRGTTLEAMMRRLQAESFPALQIESVTDYQSIVQRLSRDPKAFAYLDLNIYWTARKHGAAIKRHRVADGPPEDFGFIMPLGSDWQAPLAEFFAANGGYRRSREYRQLIIKHLGVDLKELLQGGGSR